MKECGFVDFFSPISVSDAHDLDMTIASLKKHVEQHVKALGQVFHVLGHRAGYVHQTKHDCLRYRLRDGFETPVSYVDRIYERYAASLHLERFDLLGQFDAPPLVLAFGQFGLEL